MTLEVHTVDLKARDGISPVLRQVSGSAQTMARDVDHAAETGRRGFERWSQAGAALGMTLGTAGGLLADFARAAAEEEVIFTRLQSSVEATGRSYDQYGDAIDRAIKRGEELSFADDKVAEALAGLTTQTGDAGVALDNIGLAMDVARARGIDLATAATLIGKVYEGNLGVLTRYGIAVEEGMTSTEALALLQQRTAGQAEAYANTSQGAFDRWRNSIDNATESIGAHTGALQSLLMMAPGLSAMYTGLAGLIGAVGGFGAIAGAAGPAALIAGGAGLAYAYGSDQYGATTANTLSNNLFLYGSKALNAFLPGNPYDEQKYIEQMRLNDVNSAIDQTLIAPGEKRDVAFDRVRMLTGTITGEMSDNELAKYVEQAARAAGLTVGAYLMQRAESSGFIRDPLSGTYLPRTDYNRYSISRGTLYGTMGAGLSSPYVGGKPYDPYGDRTPYDAGPYSGKRGMHVDYLAESYGSMAAYGTASYMATPGYAEAQRAAEFKQLKAQYGGFAGVVQGVDSRHDVTTAFNAAQGNILGQEQVYGGQISEYTQQMNSLTAAYEILQQRQADGVKLSQDEQELLKNYPELYERVSGGVEDATVQQGLLAAAYIENMGINDQMNQTLAGTNDVLGTLTDVLALYIATLEGVPSEVKTEIHLNTDPALAALAEFLNMIPGSFTVPMYVSGSDINAFLGGGQGRMHGGVIETAFTGRMTGGRYTLVGEGGPEIVSLPGGSLVTPAGASRAAMQGGSGGITINGPIHVYANDAMEFADSMRAMRYAEARA